MKSLLPPLILLSIMGLPCTTIASPTTDAERFAEAIEKINAAHLRKPGTTTEEELLEDFPRAATRSLERVLKSKPSAETSAALLKCGTATIDLAASEHFQKVRTRLLEIDAESASELGDLVVRDRFLVHGVGDFAEGYLPHFADVSDAILDAYDEVFGFQEWSKVPGKKIRIHVHLVPQITRPPHFAPQFPYHSQIDMPVIDREGFRSPTAKGHMMFYGLCHEFGHLIAMWGDRQSMEDHHAWAHYTGVVIVEHMAKKEKYAPILKNLRDVKWRSLSTERQKPENQVEPSTENRASVMALLIRLHDLAGPENIGAALNLMSNKAMGHRINQVRYYTFDDLETALGTMTKDAQMKRALSDIFP